MIAGVMTGLGMLAILAAAAGFGGAIHPLGDSLAVFQLPLALTGMVMLMPAKRQWFWPAAIVGTMSMLNVLWPKMVPTAPGTYTVYQKNLSFRQHEQAELAADILQRDTDIVTVQEVNEPNMAILEAIKAEYPTQAWCPFDFVGGTAVATKWPALGDVVCSDVGGLTALKVQSPSGPVWLVSLHLHWPWPFGQDAQIEALLPVLEGVDAPIVLGGDFNMVPWSNLVSRVMEASGTVYSGVRSPTYYIKEMVPIPIDHVLAGGGTGEVLPLLDSDHLGVLAQVSLPPSR